MVGLINQRRYASTAPLIWFMWCELLPTFWV